MRISDWSSDVCSSDLVPDYPKLAQLWWQQIGDVNSGAFTPQEAMDRLASEMDQVMARMQQADEQAQAHGGCGPRLTAEKDPSERSGQPDGPAAQAAYAEAKGSANAYRTERTPRAYTANEHETVK